MVARETCGRSFAASTISSPWSALGALSAERNGSPRGSDINGGMVGYRLKVWWDVIVFVSGQSLARTAVSGTAAGPGAGRALGDDVPLVVPGVGIWNGRSCTPEVLARVLTSSTAVGGGR